MGEANHNQKDILGFIAGIKTWKKTFITIVLIFAGGVGMTLYQQRRELTMLAMSHFGAPSVNEAIIDDEAKSFMTATGSVALSVWSVNLSRNQRTSLYFRILDRRIYSLEGISDVALRPYSDHSRQIIRLLSENTICYDILRVTAIGQKAADAGVKYVCSARVPQRAGVFVGMVAAGFKEKPEHEDYVRVRLMQTADKLIH